MRGVRAVLFATLVMLLMPLSGCVGSNVPSWGAGSGEITVSVDDDRVNIDSRLTGSLHSMSVTKEGCPEPGEEGEPYVLEGWLSQYHHYLESADEPGDDDDLLMAVTTVVIVEIMDFSMAMQQSPPNAKRVDVKDFGDPVTSGKANPLSPRTLGEPKLDKDTGYMTLGLIPASENILFGLNALDWHTPVRLEGYFLAKDNDSNIGNSIGKHPDHISCRLTKGPGGEAFFTTKVQIGEDTIVSMNGESDDEWVNGDVPLLGRWAYTISLMAIGGGGAFGMFILSTAMQRRSAAAAASMLLGKDRVSKAKGIKKEIKEAREDGLEISKTKRKKESKPSAGPKVKEEELKGFSLDNVLSSGPSISSNTMEMGGGSVLVTDETIDMEEKLQDVQASSSGFVDSIIGGSAQPASRGPPGGGARQQAAPPSQATRSAPPAQERAPPRERTSPRSQQQARSRGPPQRQQREERRPPQQESPAPRQRRPSMADDDDFSDFSF